MSSRNRRKVAHQAGKVGLHGLQKSQIWKDLSPLTFALDVRKEELISTFSGTKTMARMVATVRHRTAIEQFPNCDGFCWLEMCRDQTSAGAKDWCGHVHKARATGIPKGDAESEYSLD